MIYNCIVCEYSYDEELGCVQSNVPPGTRVEDLPDDWTCPECGVSKDYLVEEK